MYTTFALHSHISAGAVEYRLSSSRPNHQEEHIAAIQRYTHTLIGQIAEGWTLVIPITLTIERDEDGAYLASETITTVYGYGHSGPEAIQDYIQSLVEYFEIVNASTLFESLELAGELGSYLTKSQAK